MITQVDSKMKDMRWSYMIKDKVIKNPKLLEQGVAKHLCLSLS